MCGFVKVERQAGDGGKRKGSQSLLSLLSPCVQVMKYQHKQETNPDALSHCWDNLSLGFPPWETSLIRLQPLSLQSLTAKQTSLKRKNCMDIPCLLFRPFENSAVEGCSCPVVALLRVGISNKTPVFPSGRSSYLQQTALRQYNPSWELDRTLGKHMQKVTNVLLFRLIRKVKMVGFSSTLKKKKKVVLSSQVILGLFLPSPSSVPFKGSLIFRTAFGFTSCQTKKITASLLFHIQRRICFRDPSLTDYRLVCRHY